MHIWTPENKIIKPWIDIHDPTPPSIQRKQRFPEYQERLPEYQAMSYLTNPYSVVPAGHLTGTKPTKTNLKTWWSFNEASGNRADSHGSNTLTDNNTVTSVAGKQGNAAEFTRANTEYLSITSNTDVSITTGQDCTIGGWVYFKTLNFQFIVAKSHSSTTNQWEYWMEYNGVSVVYAKWAIDAFGFTYNNPFNYNGSVWAPSNGLVTGTWFFVVMQWDKTNSQTRTSVNAQAFNNVALTGNVRNPGTEFRFGTSVDSASPFDGYLDEWFIWKESLSINNITWLYNDGAGTVYADLA